MAAGISAAGWAAISAVVSSAVSIYNGQQQQKAAGQAQAQAKKSAELQALQADEANGRANQKKADITSILAAAQDSAKMGLGGTLLTGAQGVDPNQLLLGKSTLLGQ